MKKSYYAIIPADVRYDKNLKANAKLLYGEITALCNEKGYCWANNSYFADLYEVEKETVSRWISNLEKSGYITTQLIYGKGTKEVTERRIHLGNDEIINTSCQNSHGGIDKKVKGGIDEKVKDNNTSFNNTSNNTVNKKNSASSDTQHASSSKTKDTSKKKEDKQAIEETFENMWKLYPVKKGKGQVKHEGRKRIHKLGDEFKRCIDRYINEVEEERRKGFKELRFQQGSTFFNSGYVDYLDENYEGGNISAGNRYSVNGSYSEIAKTDYSHLTESKQLTDAEREQNERELEELGYF